MFLYSHNQINSFKSLALTRKYQIIEEEEDKSKKKNKTKPKQNKTKTNKIEHQTQEITER